MGEFFNGWRRKIGLLTLVMACVFMAGWIRSLQRVDSRIVFTSTSSSLQLISGNATITVRRFVSPHAVKSLPGLVDRLLLVGVFPPSGNSSGNVAFSIDEKSRLQIGNPYSWTVKTGGFGIGQVKDKDLPLQVFVWAVPYWFIVISLTLLSAYLLLNKPRQSNQHQNDEPIPEKVA